MSSLVNDDSKVSEQESSDYDGDPLVSSSTLETTILITLSSDSSIRTHTSSDSDRRETPTPTSGHVDSSVDSEHKSDSDEGKLTISVSRRLDSSVSTEINLKSDEWKTTSIPTTDSVGSDPTLSASDLSRSPLASTVHLGSSMFTASASLDHQNKILPNAGSSRPGSAQTIGLVLGLLFGLFALTGVSLAVWFFALRDRIEEDQQGEIEFETESDRWEVTPDGNMEDCPSGYQTEDMDDFMVDGFVLSDAFSRDNEETQRPNMV
jgi:hypothetical protein